jgi:hypothetical protein
MIAGMKRYAANCEAKGNTGGEFVMHASRFFGASLQFELSWDIAASDSHSQSVQNSSALNTRAPVQSAPISSGSDVVRASARERAPALRVIATHNRTIQSLFDSKERENCALHTEIRRSRRLFCL